MRLLLLLGASLALTGCMSVPGGNSEAMLQTLQNLRHCERVYVGSIGMGGAASISIKCPPEPYRTAADEAPE